MTTVEKLDIAIKVMKRVEAEGRAFDMSVFADRPTFPDLDPEGGYTDLGFTQSLWECGTAGCFAGTFAMSPEGRALGWRLDQKYISTEGGPEPYYEDANSKRHWTANGAAEFFRISRPEAMRLIYGPYGERADSYYHTPLPDVTIPMVIERLEELRARYELAYEEEVGV